MALNAAQMYLSNSIKTASPAKLTLMLYDGAIKFCNIAKEGFKENNIEKINTNVIKAEKIINELRATLDMKYEVSKDFDRMYDYIYRNLVEANVYKDQESLEEALTQIRGMRETWVEVMKLNNAK